MILTAGQKNYARVCDTPIGGSLLAIIKKCDENVAQAPATILLSCEGCVLVCFETPCLDQGYYDLVITGGANPFKTLKVYVQA